MLSSRRHEEFGRRVAEATGVRSGLPTSRLLDDAALGSGLMLGWDVARKAHLLTPGTTILMIEAGPGRIAALALYNC